MKNAFIVLAIIVVSVSALVGCNKEDTSSTPTTTPAATNSASTNQ